MANIANITASGSRIGKGVFFRGVLGTPLPQSATEELNAAFEDQGIVGESGVVQTPTRDLTDINDYDGDTVYTVQASFGEETQVEVYESRSVPTLRTLYGDSNVQEVNGEIVVQHNKTRLPRSSFVLDHLDDVGEVRQVIGIGQVVTVGAITRVSTDIVRYTVTIRHYPDSNGNTMVEYLVNAGNAAALQINSVAVGAGTVDTAYSAQIIASGGAAPLSFAVVAGALPSGVTLSATGQLSGTPTADGTFTFTVEVEDNNGVTVTREYTLTIAE